MLHSEHLKANKLICVVGRMDALEKLKKDNQIYERVSGGIITVTIEER